MSEVKRLRIEGQSVTVARLNNLTSKHEEVYLGRFLLFYQDLAEELGEPLDRIDELLTALAEVAAHTTGYDKLPQMSDTTDELRAKCKAWLTDSNPKIAERLVDAVEAVDASWGSIEEGPLPLPEGADPNL